LSVTLSLCSLSTRLPPAATLFPYTTLFRSAGAKRRVRWASRELQATESRARFDHTAECSTNAMEAASGTGATGALCTTTPLLARSEEHTSELSHVSISYAVFCLKKKKKYNV